jgi:hypothetical protein
MGRLMASHDRQIPCEMARKGDMVVRAISLASNTV